MNLLAKILMMLFLMIAADTLKAQDSSLNRKAAMTVLAKPLNRSELNIREKFHFKSIANNASLTSSFTLVPKFQRHPGALFCRMEDAVERRTKLFKFTVGVGLK